MPRSHTKGIHRMKALRRWIKGRGKEPTKVEKEIFIKGFNMGWNAKSKYIHNKLGVGFGGKPSVEERFKSCALPSSATAVTPTPDTNKVGKK